MASSDTAKNKTTRATATEDGDSRAGRFWLEEAARLN